MAKLRKEFIDKDRSVSSKYYDLMEKIPMMSIASVKKEAKKLIEQDPDFFDSYSILCEILQEEGKFKQADTLLDTAYQRSITMITDKKNNWPAELEWGWLENRHIIRIIFNKAVQLWSKKEKDSAISILRKLLRSNPGDNIGARHFILAIRMNMSFEKFETRFNKGGFYDNDLNDWFEENYKKFPDEFEWWDKYFND